MLKTFYSDSVESALHAARTALGEETMLVDAGASAPEEVARGPFRVVAIGPEEGSAESGAAAQQEPLSRQQSDPVILDRLRAELRSMRESLDAVGALAARTALDRSALAQTPELAPWIRKLLEMDVPACLAQSIADAAARRLRADPAAAAAFTPPSVRRAIAAELESRLDVQPGFGREAGRCKTVALAGPPGAGKTTTLAKLAMRRAVSGRQQAMILSLDVFRIGAAEQLRGLATILGVPFRLCETPSALRRALDDARDRDMVFIDTPGAGAAELEWWQAWAPRLVAESDVEIQVVLPATASHGQLASWVRQYRSLKPSRLLFTQLDEAVAFGGLLSAGAEACLPISYLTNGQGIPEDIEPATKARLLELLIGENGALGTAA
jgi:flagellar biosynthesis protein FlhF